MRGLDEAQKGWWEMTEGWGKGEGVRGRQEERQCGARNGRRET